MSKRSRQVSLALLGAAAFSLAACKEETVESVVVRNPQDCAALSGFSRTECEAGLKEAQAQHEATAPRYDALAVCEEQHGEGQCQQEAGASGGGSVFMPILAGYMLGRMLGGAGAAGLGSKPLYQTRGGGFATADGKARVNGLGGTAAISKSGYGASAVTKGAAPMSRADVAAKGGFGASRTMSGQGTSAGG